MTKAILLNRSLVLQLALMRAGCGPEEVSRYILCFEENWLDTEYECDGADAQPPSSPIDSSCDQAATEATECLRAAY